MAHSEFYQVDGSGSSWIHRWLTKGQSERMQDRAEVVLALKKVVPELPKSLPFSLDYQLHDIETLGEPIAGSAMRILRLNWRNRAHPVLIREGITLEEIVTKLAGPSVARPNQSLKV